MTTVRTSVPVSATAVRRTVLQMLHRAKAGHLGTCMSMIEMLIAMYSTVDVEKIRKGAKDRDRVIVSKGHGAAAVYGVMHHCGLISAEDITTYHSDGSLLTGHVSHMVPCVEHSTGALGHGLSVGAGCGLGLKRQGVRDASVLVLMGDGEIQEGSVWEALMFIRHHALTNVVALIDNNRISSITRTDQVIDLKPLANHFAGFGFAGFEVDGHDVMAVADAIRKARFGNAPGVVICETVKGKGVPFAEHEPIWHYRTLTDELLRDALQHLDSHAS